MSLVTDALGHHRSDRSHATAVIDVWDVAETGASRPAGPMPGSSWTAGSRSARSHGSETVPTVLADYRTDTDTVFAFDVAGSQGFVCTGDAAAMPRYERSAPLLPVLHWLLARHGVQVVHGGAVVHKGRAALVVGPGGAGKSTTCLSAIGSELGCLADDYCALEPVDGGWVVHGISAIAKVEPQGLRLLPALGGLVDPVDLAGRTEAHDEKLLVHLRRGARPLPRRAQLAAVVVPDLAGAARRSVPSLERIPPAVAFRALAPSTLSQLPGAGAGAAKVIARALADTPAFRLEPTSDPTRLPEVIAALLDGSAWR
ncbi:MAG: hypothetical protein RIE08_02510 [Acidimicrobiales bacterium]